MEDKVKDAITFEDLRNDPVLVTLINITLNSIRTERPLFDNPLREPVLYSRYFCNWVKEALEERKQLNIAYQAENKKLGIG